MYLSVALLTAAAPIGHAVELSYYLPENVQYDERVPVQADGDIITVLPVRIRIDAEPVNLIYPAA